MKVAAASEGPVRAGVAAGATLLGLLIFRLRFCGDVALPELPPRPPAPAVVVADVRRAAPVRDRGAYAAQIASDARGWEVVPAPSVDELARPLPHRREATSIVLDPRDAARQAASVLGLDLAISVQAADGINRQMVLSITNTTATPLAYRVVTRPSRGLKPCRLKTNLAHDAVAILPGATERRSECLWNEGWTLSIDEVEVVELSPLSFHYVAALPPERIGLEARTGRGHRPPLGQAVCGLYHPADVDDRIRSGAIPWRDVVDFYARHNCKTYSFTDGYEAIEPGATVDLPAAPATGG